MTFTRSRSYSILIVTLLITVVLLLILAAPVTAVPTTRYVHHAGGMDAGDCTDSHNPCRTIGYALSQSFQGDDIKVTQGIYEENLVIENNVNLYGGFAAGNWNQQPSLYGSTIDGQQLGSVIRYEGGFAGVLDGFKITNGKAAQGGGVFSELGSPELNHVWITGNEASDDGGGVYLDGNQPSITNSKLDHNVAADFGGAIYIVNGAPTLQYLEIKNNTARSGAGMSMHNTGEVKMLNSVLTLNEATSQGGAINVQDAYLVLEDSMVARNRGDIHGGAMTAEGSQIDIINGLFFKNSTTAAVASVLAMSSSEVFVVNSTFADNDPLGQQAVLQWGADGGYFVKNSIMWNSVLAYEAIFPPCPSCFIADWSNIQGYGGGTHNINADPLFRSPETDDYQLDAASPCIDAGTASGGFIAPEYDIAGNPRDSKPDMGAYEYAPPVYKYHGYLPVVTGE